MRVVVDRLSKTYTDGRGHEIQALGDVSLTVGAEELVAILGPSGCGKSTLLATFPVPKIALLPLLILWLGLGETPKDRGDRARRLLSDGDQHLRRRAAGRPAARARRGGVRCAPLVGDPQGHPALGVADDLRGLRLGAGTALLLLVAAEMIAVESGIGFLVLHAGNIMATTKLMVGIVLLSLLGVLSHWGLGRLERLAIPWRT